MALKKFGNIWLVGYGGLLKLSRFPTGMNEKDSDNAVVNTIQTPNEIILKIGIADKLVQIYVYALDGKTAHKVDVLTSEYVLDTTKFAKGIYINFILRGYNIYTQKQLIFITKLTNFFLSVLKLLPLKK